MIKSKCPSKIHTFIYMLQKLFSGFLEGFYLPVYVDEGHSE